MRKLILSLFLVFGLCSSVLAATELKRYVCTTSSGGDGTTSATSGANAAYAHLNDAIDYLQASYANLVTADVYANIEITGDCSTADTTAVDISSITTNSTHYINIYTVSSARHKGKWSTAYYRLDNSTLNSANIYIHTFYTTIDGLQFFRSTPGTWDHTGIDGFQSDYCVIKNNLFNGGKVFKGAIDLLYAMDGLVENNIIYGLTRNGDNDIGAGIYARDDRCSIRIYNNTVYGSYLGIYGYNDTYDPLVKNNICYNNTTDYSGTFDSASTNNLAKDTTTPEYNTYYDSKTLTFTNVSAGTEDFHLVSTDTDAIDKGADLSGTFTDDIDGVTRSGTWDIGADEYVAVITTTGQVIIIGD